MIAAGPRLSLLSSSHLLVHELGAELVGPANKNSLAAVSLFLAVLRHAPKGLKWRPLGNLIPGREGRGSGPSSEPFRNPHTSMGQRELNATEKENPYIRLGYLHQCS